MGGSREAGGTAGRARCLQRTVLKTKEGKSRCGQTLVAARQWGGDEIKHLRGCGGDGQDWETVKFKVLGSATRGRDM